MIAAGLSNTNLDTSENHYAERFNQPFSWAKKQQQCLLETAIKLHILSAACPASDTAYLWQMVASLQVARLLMTQPARSAPHLGTLARGPWTAAAAHQRMTCK
jgi:hypothetical protein